MQNICTANIRADVLSEKTGFSGIRKGSPIFSRMNVVNLRKWETCTAPVRSESLRLRHKKFCRTQSSTCYTDSTNMDYVYNFLSEYKVIITITHILGVVVGMGAALVSDFLFSFYSHDKRLSRSETYTLGLLSNIVWTGLIIITVSGIGLFLSDIEKYLESTKFLAKMSILAVLVFNGYVLNRYISKSMIKRGFLSFHKYTKLRKLAFACGAISVVSWLSVLSLGVVSKIHLPYEALMEIYGTVIIGAIVISLIVERNTFENSR